MKRRRQYGEIWLYQSVREGSKSRATISSHTEKTVLLSIAKEIHESTEINENYSNTWELADGVIDLTSGVQASMTDEEEYTLENCTIVLKAGDIYAVLIDGMPLVKKVKSVSTEGTTYVVQTESVALSDAYKNLDIVK
ncbi:MAG: hypothetical protein IJ794_02090 [Lachnospiraceae bacterium]|nr:hypothetical protein [Lachnospiraceae bacterium]